MSGRPNQPFLQSRPDDDNTVIAPGVLQQSHVMLIGKFRQCREVERLRGIGIFINHSDACIRSLERVANSSLVIVMKALPSGAAKLPGEYFVWLALQMQHQSAK